MAGASRDSANEPPAASCPECGYDLRAHEGASVICPECGTDVDRAKVLLAQWHGSWMNAPGFNEFLGPAIWAGLFLPLLVILWLIPDRLPGGLVTTTVGSVAMAAWWVWAVWRAGGVLAHGHGIGLALLLHAIWVGYLLAAALYVAATVAALGAMLHGLLFVLALMILLGAIVLTVICRRGERFVAYACIRAALASPAVPQHPAQEYP